MTVYILFYNNFNGDDEFCGVYASPEAAQREINKYAKHDQPSFRIEEYEVEA